MNDRINQMKPFWERPVAHRGLHNNASDAPENTLKAFGLAVEQGYGIELDVQQSKDGKLVVVHDGDLKRVCGIDRPVNSLTYDELLQYPICQSQERIPLFEEVLKLVDGRVPLIVEIKSDGDYMETCRKTAEMLDGYKGCYCVESFHPRIVGWFRSHRPAVIRGQLSEDYKKENEPGGPFVNWLLTNMVFNLFTHPDFVAYHHAYYNHPAMRRIRRSKRIVPVAWTIKSQEEYDRAKQYFRVLIFDSFIPAENEEKRIQ